MLKIENYIYLSLAGNILHLMNNIYSVIKVISWEAKSTFCRESFKKQLTKSIHKW